MVQVVPRAGGGIFSSSCCVSAMGSLSPVRFLMFVCSQVAKSHEIMMFVCLQKDNEQCCDAIKPTVLIVLIID